MSLSPEARNEFNKMLAQGVNRRTAYRRCEQMFGTEYKQCVQKIRKAKPEFKYEYSKGRWV